MPCVSYVPIVGSNLKLTVFIAAFGQSNVLRAVLLETGINIAAFCLQAVELLNTSFWKCFLYLVFSTSSK